MEAISDGQRTDVLARICDLLPSDVAGPIREMDPTIYRTYALAYVAVRRNDVGVDPDLLRQLLRVLFDFHDEGVAEATLEEERPASSRVPTQRHRLTLVRRATQLA